MRLNLETRLGLVKLYYGNNGNAAATMRACKKKKAMRKDQFPLSTFTQLISKFETTKILHDLSSSDNPSLEEGRAGAVVEAMTSLQSTNPHDHASSRGVSAHTGISQSSVIRILHHQGMNPYRISLVQSINQSDNPKRLAFANWVS